MKRYNIVMLITFCLLTLSFNISPLYASLPLTGKVVIIDPGHGGLDPGTLHGKTLEKDINLEISLELEKELSKLGALVLLTREGDYDLSEPNASLRKKSDFDNRIKLINESKADVYISIHLNYLSNNKYYGPQVFYNKENKDLAELLQNNLNEELKTKRNIQKVPSDTYMYSRLDIEGVLVECGFLSNENERYKLTTTEYQKKLAEIIASSINEFL